MSHLARVWAWLTADTENLWHELVRILLALVLAPFVLVALAALVAFIQWHTIGPLPQQ